MRKSGSTIKSTIKSGFMRSVTIPLALIFIVLITAIIVIVYLSFSSDLKENISIRKAEELQVVEQNISNRFDEISSITYDMYRNSEFTFADVQTIKGAGYAMCEELKKYMVGNEFVKYLAFYRKSTPGKIYTSEGEFSCKNFWDAYLKYEGTDYDMFYSLITAGAKSCVLSFKSNADGHDYMMIIDPIPQYSVHPQAYSIAFVDRKAMDSYSENLFLDCSGALCISDAMGNPIYGYSTEGLEVQVFEETAQRTVQGGEIIKINGRDYLTEVRVSSVGSRKYVSFVDMKEIMFEVYKLEGLLVVTLVLMVIVAIAACIFCIIVNFRPINQLAVSMMKENSAGFDENSIINERSLLRTTFLSLIEEKKKIYDELFFSNLLAEQYDENLLEDALEEYGISFGHESYCSMVVIPKVDQPSKALLEKIRILVNDNLGSEEITVYTCSLSKPMSVLVCLNCDSEKLQANPLDSLSTAVHELIVNKLDTEVSIGAGKVRESLLGFSQATYEAVSAAYYATEQEGNFFVNYALMENDSTSEKISGIISEIGLLIKKGRSEEISEAFYRLKETACRKHISVVFNKYTAYSLSMLILEYVRDTEEEKEISEVLPKLMTGAYSAEAVYDRLEEISVQIAQSRSKNQKGQKDELLDNIKQVISDRLCDSMLSLDAIADSCQISSSYLSRYFKQRMGCTPMVYVENARMDIAKEMLKTTDKSLDEILDGTGYIDKSNFIRKFKKREGLTPMGYRKSYSEG